MAEKYIPKYRCPYCEGYPLNFSTAKLRNVTRVFVIGESPADFEITCACCGQKLGVQMKPLELYRTSTQRASAV